ncbi:MAG TPA: hypothetical protein VG324_19610 [Blastocatellia bacterium]|nr:hypothetical protein [Blastocatellia bacterium]
MEENTGKGKQYRAGHAAKEARGKDNLPELGVKEKGRSEMNWEGFGLKLVGVEDDLKTFEVQLPATLPLDAVRFIAALGMMLEEGLASLDLCDVDGRPTIFFTASEKAFSLAIDAEKWPTK